MSESLRSTVRQSAAATRSAAVKAVGWARSGPSEAPESRDGATGSPVSLAAEPAQRNVPDDFFHQMLHELRTLELERLDIDGGRALSIGASGSWYFDWFERSVGPVDEHIGVEAFEPMPDDLPPYVRWNTSTADRFEGVDDDSVDLVFAGQTTEHLWACELTDFLLESHRVLRTGARLVLDSPNRPVTQFLHWSHGGHTVELGHEEIVELLELAGFEVEVCRGVLVTRIDGRVLDLEEGFDRGDVTARRLRRGEDILDDSFIWWVVARRTDRVPNRDELLSAVERFFWVHWPTRISRGIWNPGLQSEISVPRGTSGPVGTTLPFPISAGTWALGLDIKGDASDSGIEVRVLDAGGKAVRVLSSANAWVTEGRLSWQFAFPELVFGCSVQLVASEPDSDLTVTMPIDLRATSGIGVRAVS